MKRLVLASSIVAMLAIGAATAQGAPAPRHLGEAASALTAEANCNCTAIQFGDLGTSNNSYAFPYSGVITRSGFYVGEEVGAGDWVQMRSFAHSGANRATVTGDGGKHMLQGRTPKAISTFYERLPVGAGGVLGARYSLDNFFNATPTYFSSASSQDEVIGTTTSLAIGDSWEETPAKTNASTSKLCSSPTKTKTATGTPPRTSAPVRQSGEGPARGRSSAATSRRR